MISERALRFVDEVVLDGMRSALARPDQDVQLSLESGEPALAKPAMTRDGVCVVLTVTCYTFRMMWVMLFSRDVATYAYLAGLRGKSVDDLSATQRADLLSECGNMCCGSINRDLGLVFPHLGMSTPITLPSGSLQHLDVLAFDQLRRYHLTDGNGISFRGLLGISDFGDLDFSPPPRAPAQASGELELF